jgi:hypothetical protein
VGREGDWADVAESMRNDMEARLRAQAAKHEAAMSEALESKEAHFRAFLQKVGLERDEAVRAAEAGKDREWAERLQSAVAARAQEAAEAVAAVEQRKEQEWRRRVADVLQEKERWVANWMTK